MRIIGIDYSMSSPGICIFSGRSEDFCFESCQLHFLTDRKKFEGHFGNITGHPHLDYVDDMQRFNQISEWVMRFAVDCDRIFLENYSYGSCGRVFGIAENTGILKFKLWQRKIPVTVIAPTQNKKFATGKGNSRKDQMYTAFLKDTKVDLCKLLDTKTKKIESPISDIVDAFYLTSYGINLYKNKVIK